MAKEEITFDINRLTNELKFERLKLAVTRAFGKTLRDSIKVGVHEDEILEQLIYEMRGFVLAQKIAEDKYRTSFTFYQYQSAWQMFKDLHLPERFKEKYPVKKYPITEYKTIKFKRLATYPMANEKIPPTSPLYVRLGNMEVIKDDVYEE